MNQGRRRSPEAIMVQVFADEWGKQTYGPLFTGTEMTHLTNGYRFSVSFFDEEREKDRKDVFTFPNLHKAKEFFSHV